MPERYDLRNMQYGPDPMKFFEDTFNRISDELSPGQEATVVVDPENMNEPVNQVAGLAETAGLSVLATREIASDEAIIEVKKHAA
ncbi:MAG: hypothetical protein K6T91_04205 [Firmicutes bacterium]|nr:hypothetical protein [Bacillota bacterium]